MAPSRLHTALQRRSAGMLIGTLIAALVVAGVAGFAIGFKVEQSRTRNEVKKAKQGQTAKKKKKVAVKATAVSVIGKVSAKTSNTMTVVDGRGTEHKIAFGKASVVVIAAKADQGALKTGMKILYWPVKGNYKTASEVVVLPADAKVGAKVTKTDANSVTLAGAKGNAIVVSTTGATYDTVTAGHLGDIPNNAEVSIRALKRGTTVTAVEVVVLPAGTAFGKAA